LEEGHHKDEKNDPEGDIARITQEKSPNLAALDHAFGLH
jgi:hypothetical protein